MGFYDPWPPSSLPNIKEYYSPQPPSPPQNNKGCQGPQPPYQPLNKDCYGYQSPSAQLTKKEYYDLRYPSLTPVNEGYYDLQPQFRPPNNEGYFGPEFSYQLPYEKENSDSQSTSPSSEGQYGLHPPFTPSEGSNGLLPPFLISSDVANDMIEPQFALLHNKATPISFRDTSAEDSVDPSFLQVSVVPSVSFTIQDATQFGELNAVLEDPLTVVRNLSHASGTLRDSTLKPGPSHLTSPHGDNIEVTGNSHCPILL
jgi:hypothetical protein